MIGNFGLKLTPRSVPASQSDTLRVQGISLMPPLLVPKTKSSSGYKIVVLSAVGPGNTYSSKILQQGRVKALTGSSSP